MKRKIITLLLMLVLLAMCFAFVGCQNQLEIEDYQSVVGIDITRKSITENDGDISYLWVVKYYVDPEKWDLSTVNSVKVKTFISKFDNFSNKETYLKAFTGIIPDDAAPTAENNYFYMELKPSDYDPTAERPYDYTTGEWSDNFTTDAQGVKHYFPSEHLVLKQCFFYVDDNSDDAAGDTVDDPTDGITGIPSIGMTLLTGLIMAFLSFGLYWIAVVVFNQKIVVAIAFLIPIILTVTSWFVWGWVRGLIMTGFFVIYYIAVGLFNKALGDYL